MNSAAEATEAVVYACTGALDTCCGRPDGAWLYAYLSNGDKDWGLRETPTSITRAMTMARPIVDETRGMVGCVECREWAAQRYITVCSCSSVQSGS